MKAKDSLKIILVFAIAGVLFSGYLSYQELCGNGTSCQTISRILGVPVCVFGLIMYTVILLVTIIGLRSKK